MRTTRRLALSRYTRRRPAQREWRQVQEILTATRGNHGQSLAFASALRQANWTYRSGLERYVRAQYPPSRRRLWHRSAYIEDDIAQYFSVLAEFMCHGDVAQRQASSNRVN